MLTPFSGVDFDDPEYGFKEEDKDPIKVCCLFLLCLMSTDTRQLCRQKTKLSCEVLLKTAMVLTEH